MKLINSDCLSALNDIDDNSIDCIITSPPYWKGFAYEAYFNSYSQYLRWCNKWLKECKRILKTDGTFYLNVINDSEITTRAYEIMDRIKSGHVYKIDLNVLNLIESMIKRIQRLKSENKTGDNNEPPTKTPD